MSKYIDAEKLKIWIAQIQKEHPYHPYREDYESGCDEGYLGCCDELLSFIASLQQEQSEVDLEVKKQIEELANDWHHKGFASDEDCPLCMQDLIDILWYFYELGLNARKKE